MPRLRRSFGRLFKRAGSTNWYVRFCFRGRVIERVGGPNRDLAARKPAKVHLLNAEGSTLQRVLEDVFGDVPASSKRTTLRAAVPLYLAGARGHLKESTREGYSRILEALLKEGWADRYLDEIDPSMLKAWRAARQD